MEDDRRARELKERSRAAFGAQAATTTRGWRATTRAGSTRSWPRRSPRRSPARRGPRLLDLGCGTGALAELVLARVPGSRLSCVDPLAPHGRRRAGAARLARGGRGRRRGGAAVSRESFDAAWVATTPSTTTPTPTGRRSRYGARSGREGRSSSGRLAARARPRPHERVDAAFPRGRRAHLLGGRDARDPRQVGSTRSTGAGSGRPRASASPGRAGRAPKGAPPRDAVPYPKRERNAPQRGTALHVSAAEWYVLADQGPQGPASPPKEGPRQQGNGRTMNHADLIVARIERPGRSAG